MWFCVPLNGEIGEIRVAQRNVKGNEKTSRRKMNLDCIGEGRSFAILREHDDHGAPLDSLSRVAKIDDSS